MLTGRVRKYHSNFYYVEAEGIEYECAVRGLLKKEGTDVLVGDMVELDSINETIKSARIHSVLPRKNVITRPKIANVDQVIVLYSLREPEFDPNQLDRYLTHVELAGLPAIICISKADLSDSQDELEEIRDLYEKQLGYAVFFTSIRQPDSLKAIRDAAQGKVNVLAGPSGSGKSSLLNALNAGLNLRVGDVSEKIARGAHTTRHVELLEVEPGCFIADTPGFSNLKFSYVLPETLERVMRDFAPFRDKCEFSDCLHDPATHTEEDCAVLANLETIIQSRFQSYLDMMAEARLYKEEVQVTSQKQEGPYKTLDRKGKEAKILRLSDRDREAARNTRKQKISLLEEEEDEPLPDGDGDWLADAPGCDDLYGEAEE